MEEYELEEEEDAAEASEKFGSFDSLAHTLSTLAQQEHPRYWR